MERDYHSELRAIIEQLSRLNDLLEQFNKRAIQDAPLAREVLELYLKMQRKIGEELTDA